MLFCRGVLDGIAAGRVTHAFPRRDRPEAEARPAVRAADQAAELGPETVILRAT
ncbi:MAG TPA: hypothetical protein VK904_01770 [Miltoncostaeaceae bacterium]|nr:hypothetical protein [Miltoncostaeaceae bacterium]